MSAFTTLTSRVVPLLVNDVDTDQIIPARFLKTTDKTGLGASLFADWRYREDGSPDPGFVLNQPESQARQILLAGDNFGCGSSREHAPWALIGYGFRAVLSTAFADIFYNNALKNGLLPVTLKPGDYRLLTSLLADDPQAEITIDLVQQEVFLPDGSALGFPIDGFARTCLINDVDELGYLLGLEDQILAYEKTLEV
jgi:3-isopropylmalate/(R)-2-methylmalate dehydratase small subunit